MYSLVGGLLFGFMLFWLASRGFIGRFVRFSFIGGGVMGVRHLLVIDPQVDFCSPGGSLFVPGADVDMCSRLPALLRRVGGALADIHVTLDSHHLFHVAHPVAWWDYRLNRHPVTIPEGPPTVITADDVVSGRFGPPPVLRRALGDRWLRYVGALRDNDRYVLCIWPPHCLIGSPGGCIVPELLVELLRWESENYAIVDKVTKGSNPYTEHYSAIVADVPDPSDPGTQLNMGLIRALADPDVVEIGVCGEALSHCLANTVTDIANNFGDENISKLTLIRDCCSSVPGGPGPGLPSFAEMGEEFIRGMVGRGMRVSTSREWLS